MGASRNSKRCADYGSDAGSFPGLEPPNKHTDLEAVLCSAVLADGGFWLPPMVYELRFEVVAPQSRMLS